jgi:hypothetical protein
MRAAASSNERLDPYDSAGLGSIAPAIASSGSAIVDMALKPLQAPLRELKQALTITTAGSLAAAIGVVLLLIRTGRKS